MTSRRQNNRTENDKDASNSGEGSREGRIKWYVVSLMDRRIRQYRTVQ